MGAFHFTFQQPLFKLWTILTTVFYSETYLIEGEGAIAGWLQRVKQFSSKDIYFNPITFFLLGRRFWWLWFPRKEQIQTACNLPHPGQQDRSPQHHLPGGRLLAPGGRADARAGGPQQGRGRGLREQREDAALGNQTDPFAGNEERNTIKQTSLYFLQLYD